MDNRAIWSPSDEQLKSYRLYKWIKKLGFQDYDSFYKKSIDDIAWFWDEAVKELHLNWYKPYEETIQTEENWKYARWFVNGKINVAENALEKWARTGKTKNNTALTWENETGLTETYTYEQLQGEVNTIASGFLHLGMQKGDVVTLFLPMIPETVISMLALAKIGCIFSPVFSGYRSDAIAARLNASGSKYIITADGFKRRGKYINMKEEADKAIALYPSIKHAIIINRNENSLPYNNIDVAWDSLKQSPPLSETLQTYSDDVFMLIYTSGTTGKPKGAVHTHGGFPIKAAFDAGICMDVTNNDTFFWYSDMGWMMGPFLVFGGLMNGANVVLYDGAPDYPTSTRLLELCSKHAITHLGLSPTLVRSMMAKPRFDDQPHDLSSLKAICSTGEAWNPEPWIWLFKTIGKEHVPIINYSGGTEISGGIFSNILLKPISPITFNSPMPGMSADVYDENGRSIINEVGELVITKPWVGMTKGFWNDSERYEQAYWKVYENVWVHGDWISRDENGFWTITGRSDDILNIAGKRIGPAEIESSIIKHPLVIESACISAPHPIKGECSVCFAVLKEKVKPSIELENELKQLTAASLSKTLTPENIYFVPALPKTRNGKIIRRVIKAAYLNKPEGDLSSLDNPDSLIIIRRLSADSK
ncbi:AMP-binding protein [Bacillus sp. AGMB 02131]|uniref:acetate--CoA ligase n=1 Tax=Peribacillus faecalis TaxID=2772559 RepID=A0A927HCU0_9BACI|nr:AMP-binding protein [Peribacillus faecalis]MBD3109987.1 AMP-binding protein [Peribacillus faecalis]